MSAMIKFWMITSRVEWLIGPAFLMVPGEQPLGAEKSVMPTFVVMVPPLPIVMLPPLL